MPKLKVIKKFALKHEKDGSHSFDILEALGVSEKRADEVEADLKLIAAKVNKKLGHECGPQIYLEFMDTVPKNPSEVAFCSMVYEFWEEEKKRNVALGFMKKIADETIEEVMTKNAEQMKKSLSSETPIIKADGDEDTQLN